MGPQRRVAIVATAQAPAEARSLLSAVEMLVPVIHDVLAGAGLERGDVGFWCHGSCDYMAGQPFSFVAAVDALGAWPPIVESHVEADGAFALYEAWLKLQCGDADTALVFANGKTSSGPIERIMALQLDPYVVAPLWPDAHVVAGLGARACLDARRFSERQLAEVVARSWRDAIGNPAMVCSGEITVDELLAAAYTAAPLRAHDSAPVSDGACAVVLAADETATALAGRPAWIIGLDHRIDRQTLGARDLTRAPSAALAGRHAGVSARPVPEIAELHAPYSYQELLLVDELGLDPAVTAINPSGGALCANPQMAAGLARFAEAAARILDGRAGRAVAHCTSGPCLQQNLVGVLDSDAGG